MKKRVGIILLVVLLYLLIWYVGMLRQYLCWKIELYRLSDSWDVYVDEDGFNYSVALPYFAMYEGGNLALTYVDLAQEAEEFKYPDCTLIIWMKPFYGGINEMGVIIVEDNLSREIYLDSRYKTRYEDDQEYLDRHQQEVNVLLDKANAMWDLQIP